MRSTPRGRRRTRTWLAFESIAHDGADLPRIQALTEAAIAGVEAAGGQVLTVSLAPVLVPPGAFVLIAIVYREGGPTRSP